MEFLTLTKTRLLLAEEGLGARKRLGQNFLVDRNSRDKILSFARLEKTDTVVEIGAGLGSLTEGLLEQAGVVHAFEVDEGFCRVLEKRFADYPGFRLHERDFLETDGRWWNTLPEKVKVVSNTPYHLSTAIAAHILKFRSRVSLALLTVQKEVGERFTGHPESKNYAPISVLLSLYTASRICYALSKSVFYPRPEVDSVVVTIEPLSVTGANPDHEQEFSGFLPLIFRYRRKKLTNVVQKEFDLQREPFTRILDQMQLPHTTRIEELSPIQIYELFKKLKKEK